MVSGILFVLGACFVWGLIYVLPGVLIGFSPVEVTLGRYFFYGLVSLIILLFTRKWDLANLSSKIWLKALCFALVSNVIYYLLIVMGVRYASPAVAALIFGTSPIVISFYGNWKEGHASYKKLLIPTMLIVVGLFMINWEALAWGTPHGSRLTYFLGLLCSAGAVVAWTWFVAANATFLEEHPQICHSNWATILGLATLVWVIVISIILAVTIAVPSDIQRYMELSPEMMNFIWGSLALGLAASWTGFFLWNKATAILPVSLAGQLTIFETIFGLIFVFSFESRLPSPFETAGIVCMLSAIVISLSGYQRRAQKNSLEKNTLEAA